MAKFRKLISLLLVVMMVVGLFGALTTGAVAAETDETDSIITVDYYNGPGLECNVTVEVVEASSGMVLQIIELGNIYKSGSTMTIKLNPAYYHLYALAGTPTIKNGRIDGWSGTFNSEHSTSFTWSSIGNDADTMTVRLKAPDHVIRILDGNVGTIAYKEGKQLTKVESYVNYNLVQTDTVSINATALRNFELNTGDGYYYGHATNSFDYSSTQWGQTMTYVAPWQKLTYGLCTTSLGYKDKVDTVKLYFFTFDDGIDVDFTRYGVLDIGAACPSLSISYTEDGTPYSYGWPYFDQLHPMYIPRNTNISVSPNISEGYAFKLWIDADAISDTSHEHTGSLYTIQSDGTLTELPTTITIPLIGTFTLFEGAYANSKNMVMKYGDRYSRGQIALFLDRDNGGGTVDPTEPPAPTYSATYVFVSGTEGMPNLPADVTGLEKPADATGLTEAPTTPTNTYSDVEVTGGTWRFGGWSSSNSGNNYTFTGTWNYTEDEPVITYTVTYVDENGTTVLQDAVTVHTGDPITPYDYAANGTPAKASSDGKIYSFTGWKLMSGEPDGDKVGVTDLVYKAVYNGVEAGSYDVIYTDGLTGGATYTYVDGNYLYQTYSELSDNSVTNFTRENYTFVDWQLREGSVVHGERGALHGESGATIYYDAQWELAQPPVPTTYTVTYNANGGTGSMVDNNSPYAEDSEVTVLPNAFVAPSGKEFDGFYSEAAGGNKFGASFQINADTILYAHWKDVNVPNYAYTINYYLDDVLVDSDKGEAPSGSTIPAVKPDAIPGDAILYPADQAMSLSVTDVVDDNVLDVYYYTDKIGPDNDDPDEENNNPDGIPDIYQLEVTFEVHGGTWADTNNKTVLKFIVEKYDNEGNYDKDGSASISDLIPTPQPNAANFNSSGWDSDPNDVDGITQNTKYDYRYGYPGIIIPIVTPTEIPETDPPLPPAPTTDIPDPTPPLPPAPTEIPDMDTPKTGENPTSLFFWLLFCMSGSGLIVMAMTAPRKREER